MPETRYARVADARIAYQVMGEGPVDLVYRPSMVGECIDVMWEYPPYAAFLQRLASVARLIVFDPRGTGASERDVVPDDVLSWERWTQDALAVLDAVDSARAVVMGCNDAGVAAMLFAATQPDRTRALILGNSAARFVRSDDYPLGPTKPERDRVLTWVEATWGTPTQARLSDPEGGSSFARWFAKANRASCTPGIAGAYWRGLESLDVRRILPTIRTPTLVLHRRDDPYITVEEGRFVAESIPGARFVEVPGAGGAIWAPPNEEVLVAVEELLTGAPARRLQDRALAAVLFTDIVGSTEQAARMGDHEWHRLLDRHDDLTRVVVAEHGGRVVKCTGDGALATFDGPGQAIRCAFVLRDALQLLGLSVRSGLHAGEIELRGADVGGIGVHIAARLLDHAQAGELVVSQAVPLLVTGAQHEFEELGAHTLRGVPGTWQLLRAVG